VSPESVHSARLPSSIGQFGKSLGQHPVPGIRGVLIPQCRRLGRVTGTPHQLGHAGPGGRRPGEAGVTQIVIMPNSE